MPIDDEAPARLVERLAAGGEDFAGFIDIRGRDRPGQVFLENGLQAVEERAVAKAAARLDVEERRVGTGRILQPVAGLVAVGVEEKVVAALHDETAMHVRYAGELRGGACTDVTVIPSGRCHHRSHTLYQ